MNPPQKSNEDTSQVARITKELYVNIKLAKVKKEHIELKRTFTYDGIISDAKKKIEDEYDKACGNIYVRVEDIIAYEHHIKTTKFKEKLGKGLWNGITYLLAIGFYLLIGFSLFYYIKSCNNDRINKNKTELTKHITDSIQKIKDSINQADSKIAIENVLIKYNPSNFTDKQYYSDSIYFCQKIFIDKKTPAILYGGISELKKVDSGYILKLRNINSEGLGLIFGKDNIFKVNPFIATIKVNKELADSLKLFKSTYFPFSFEDYELNESGYFIVSISDITPLIIENQLEEKKGYYVKGTLLDFYFKFKK